jgi:beta-aspartyl-dipeptidase (metallo-type)
VATTLIEGGELYRPERSGPGSVLMIGGTIVKVGEVDRRALDRLAIPYEVIDATNCIVAPGLIDPHEHLLGGSGEGGFRKQTPEIRPGEIVLGGITTVVGCLGVDTTMKNMAGLLARAKALKECGLSAYLWTGGYEVPPTPLTTSVRNDILFIDEIIGVGEVALSDERSMDPDARELARVVHDAFIGGHLAGKAGVTHFHVGPGTKRLAILRTVLEQFEVQPQWIYPTHIERSEKLMDEAIDLAQRGATVDIDVVEEDLLKWITYYRSHGGPLDNLTISSDASITAPSFVLEQLRACVLDGHHQLEDLLPIATSNTARTLGLPRKGRITEGADADVLVLDRSTLQLTQLIARGQRVVADGVSRIADDGLSSQRLLQLRP